MHLAILLGWSNHWWDRGWWCWRWIPARGPGGCSSWLHVESGGLQFQKCMGKHGWWLWAGRWIRPWPKGELGWSCKCCDQPSWHAALWGMYIVGILYFALSFAHNGTCQSYNNLIVIVMELADDMSFSMVAQKYEIIINTMFGSS